MQLWNSIVSEHRKKHGGTLKEAMQSKKVKAEYQRRLKTMEKKETKTRKMSPRKKMPDKRRVTSPVKKRRSTKKM
jgi:hypothetical protein